MQLKEKINLTLLPENARQVLGELFNVLVKKIRKRKGEEVKDDKIKSKVLKSLIKENILLYNPAKGTVRPQSQLIHRAITELLK